MSYVTGKVIKELREKRNMTQRELSEILCISDKTVSKWETERGLPDISILSELASALQVSVPELLAGEQIANQNKSANMKKVSFIAYVTSDTVQLVKMYPQQEAQARFLRKGHGIFYAYCNRHGLSKMAI